MRRRSSVTPAVSSMPWRLRAQRATVPPLNEVREEIRQVLKEARLNEEIVRWTEELRLEADVVDYFDSAHEGLPEYVVSAEEANAD